MSSVKYSIHGTAQVSIIACPKILNNRLALLSTKGEYSWAIRDYITGVMLRSGNSELTLSEIEAMVMYSEEPPYRSVDRKSEWSKELESLSRERFNGQYDGQTSPSMSAGKWKRL